MSGRFREFVERFEPDTHLFHPITLNEKDGSRVEGDHYIFCARVAFDFVVIERSGIAWESVGETYPPQPMIHGHSWETHHPSHKQSEASREARYGIRASSEARGVPVIWPQHLYVSAPAVAPPLDVSGIDLWVSDEFFKAFKKSKLKYLAPKMYGFEIDEPWVAEREIGPILDRERRPPG